eukprot:TRINITY_DN122922_c0_g1_i1.p1 TRINITY_DN122922_c0_g1~~TRINITY_DN122922_c0_g1_i1.p1  ORF type:complete len:1212 (-),score=343.45 TRINITY_DN122922_c0_g1_i1:548-4183(-)
MFLKACLVFATLVCTIFALDVRTSQTGDVVQGIKAALWSSNNEGALPNISLLEGTISSSTDFSSTVAVISPQFSEIQYAIDNNVVSFGPSESKRSNFDKYPYELVNIRMSLADELQALFEFVKSIDKGSFAVFYEKDFLTDIALDVGELHGFLRDVGLQECTVKEIDATSSTVDLWTEAQTVILLTSSDLRTVIEAFAAEGHPQGKDRVFGVLSTLSDVDIDDVYMAQPFPPFDGDHSSAVEFRSVCSASNTAGTTCSPSKEAFDGFLSASTLVSAIKEVSEVGAVNAAKIKELFSGLTTLEVAKTWMGPVSSTCDSSSTVKCPCNRMMRSVFAQHRVKAGDAWIDVEEPFTFEGCGAISKEIENVTFGQVAAFTGPSANVGKCMNDGILAAFKEHNSDNFLSNYKVFLKTADDAYDPDTSIAAVKTMLEDPEVFGLIGSVGTPTSSVTFPLAVDANVPFIGAFSGSMTLRRPFFEQVINVRASYFDEAAAMVKFLVDIKGHKKISLMRQNDSFGDAGHDGILAQLASRMLWIHSEGYYERNTVEVQDGIDQIFEGHETPDAIVYFGTAAPMNEFVRTIRAAPYSWNGPIVAVSFVGGEHLSSILQQWEYRENVFVTQTTPSPSQTNLLVIQEYRNALNSLDPSIEASFCSLEGYVTGRLASFALDNVHHELTRDSFFDSIYESGVIDIGGMNLGAFGRNTDCEEDEAGCMCNQGSHNVYFTTIDIGGDLVEVEEFSQFSFLTCGFHETYVPDACDPSYWTYDVSDCGETDSERDITYRWKVPNPKNETQAWNCSGGDSLPDPLTVDCEYIEPDSSAGILVRSLSIGSIIFLFACTIWVLLWKKRRSVNNGQPTLLISGLFGAVLCCLGVYLRVNEPNSLVCVVPIIVISLGFTLMEGSLCMKVWRIKKIFLNKKLQKRRISVKQLMYYLGWIVLFDVLLLTVGALVDKPGAGLEWHHYTDYSVNEEVCETGQMFILIIAYKVLLMFGASYLSFQIRHSPDRFNESRYIFLSTYNVVLSAAVVIPIVLLLPLETATGEIIINLGILFAVVGSQAVLVLPKLFSGIQRKRVYKASQSTTNTGTNNNSTDQSIMASVDKLSTEDLITELVAAKKQILQLQDLTRRHRDKIMNYESAMSTSAGGGGQSTLSVNGLVSVNGNGGSTVFSGTTNPKVMSATMVSQVKRLFPNDNNNNSSCSANTTSSTPIQGFSPK